MLPTAVFWCFPCGHLVKNQPAMWETWLQSLGWKNALEKGRATTPVFWPREFYELCSPQGGKQSDMTE